MTSLKRALMASALALAVFALSAQAEAAGSRPVIASKSSVAVGNNVKIKSAGGTTTVDASNNCSSGVTGYLYQSVLVLFGGASYAVVQSTTCP